MSSPFLPKIQSSAGTLSSLTVTYPSTAVASARYAASPFLSLKEISSKSVSLAPLAGLIVNAAISALAAL
jgi:hypothetical protein